MASSCSPEPELDPTEQTPAETVRFDAAVAAAAAVARVRPSEIQRLDAEPPIREYIRTKYDKDARRHWVGYRLG